MTPGAAHVPAALVLQQPQAHKLERLARRILAGGGGGSRQGEEAPRSRRFRLGPQGPPTPEPVAVPGELPQHRRHDGEQADQPGQPPAGGLDPRRPLRPLTPDHRGRQHDAAQDRDRQNHAADPLEQPEQPPLLRHGLRVLAREQRVPRQDLVGNQYRPQVWPDLGVIELG